MIFRRRKKLLTALAERRTQVDNLTRTLRNQPTQQHLAQAQATLDESVDQEWLRRLPNAVHTHGALGYALDSRWRSEFALHDEVRSMGEATRRVGRLSDLELKVLIHLNERYELGWSVNNLETITDALFDLAGDRAEFRTRVSATVVELGRMQLVGHDGTIGIRAGGRWLIQQSVTPTGT